MKCFPSSKQCRALLIAVGLFLAAVITATVLLVRPNAEATTSVIKILECDNAGECLIDTSQLDLDSRSISFTLSETVTELECNQVGPRTVTWYGLCKGGGSTNLLGTGRKNDRGEELIHGSVVDGEKNIICQLSPDGDGRNRVLCKRTTDFALEADPEPWDSNDLRRLEADTGTSLSVPQNMGSLRKLAPSCDDSGAVLDILVVWTQKAECARSKKPAGCTLSDFDEEEMRSHIELAVEETNTAFRNSGINTSLRLVHAYRHPSYIEPTTTDQSDMAASVAAFRTTRNALAGTSDGVMDDVHDKRTQVCKDCKVLL